MNSKLLKKQLQHEISLAAIAQNTQRLDSNDPSILANVMKSQKAITNSDDATKLETWVTDPKQVGSFRALAVNHLGDVDAQTVDIEKLCALLAKKGEAGNVRLAIIKKLNAAAFTREDFDNYTPMFLEALRRCIDKNNKTLMKKALDTLMSYKDPSTVELLIGWTKEPENAPLALPDILSLLSIDVHAGVNEIARQLLKERDDPEIQEEVIHLLSADASNHMLLLETLQDKNRSPEIRRLAAVCMKSTSPDKFVEHVENVAFDEDDDEEIRATVLSGMLNDKQCKADCRRQEQLASLLENTNSKRVKTMLEKSGVVTKRHD